MADLTSEARGAVEAFNNADWGGARKYFADSAYTEFGTQRSVSGFDALLELMQGWKAAMPDVRGTVTGAAEEGQRVVLEIMWEGTQTGELVTEQGTIPASGNRQRTPAAWVFDYEGGQLRESRHYFDMLTFLRQIGAAQLPQAGEPGSALTVVSGGHLLLSGYAPRVAAGRMGLDVGGGLSGGNEGQGEPSVVEPAAVEMVDTQSVGPVRLAAAARA